MEINKNSADDILWDKYENIQKNFNDKVLDYQISIKYLKEILNEIDNHLKNLNNIKAESHFNKFAKLNDIFRLFIFVIKFNLENHITFINNTISNFEKFITEHKKLIPKFSEFKQFNEFYTIQQKKLTKMKEKFYESASVFENKIFEHVKKKNQNKNNNSIEIPDDFQKDVKDNLKKYQSCIEETNKKREEYVSKKKKLINNCIELENIDLDIYYNILSDFLSLEYDKMDSIVNNTKFKKLQANLNEKNIQDNSKINYIKSIEKSDNKKIIKFKSYKSQFDMDDCNNYDEYDSLKEVFNIMENNYGDIFNHNLLKIEKLKIKMKDWVKNFFTMDDKNFFINEKENEEFFKALNISSTHKSFLMALNNIRTISHNKRNKNLIELLGLSFKLILAQATNNRDFWLAKNCLILSQTFYYQENDNKIYAYEFLKNNPWLQQKNFWIGFSSYMINEELKKLYITFPELIFEDIQKNKNFSSKLNSKISNVIFSQLYTLLTNALDFLENKVFLVEIIEIFHKKYIYLTQNNIELLYQIISPDQTTIEKLKEEYIKSQDNKIVNNINNISKKEEEQKSEDDDSFEIIEHNIDKVDK